MGKKKVVLFVFPRGETIRNFIYSGIIKKLSKKNKIIILSVFPSKKILDLLNDQNCKVLELKEFKKNYITNFLRTLINISHGYILGSVAAKERRNIRRRECNSYLSIYKYYLIHFIGRVFANNIGLIILIFLEMIFTKLNHGYNYYLKLILNLKPDLVFNGSHVHSDNAAYVVHAAKSSKIPLGTFLFSWDNLTSQGRMIPTYDYYFCWNNSIKSDLIKIYNNVKEKNIFVTGTPQFDFHFDTDNYIPKNDFCEQYGLDPKRPIILYTTAQENTAIGEQAILESLADIIKEIKLPNSPQLLVRVYPKDISNRFKYLKESREDIVFPEIPWEKEYQTPLIEDIKLLVNMIKHCDVGINVASTISIELFFYDKPVINIGYNPPENFKVKMNYINFYSFDHYKPLVDSGSVVVAKKESEMLDLIVDSLNRPERNSTNRSDFIKYFFDNRHVGNFSDEFIKSFNLLIERFHKE
jgi:hypothetical protein